MYSSSVVPALFLKKTVLSTPNCPSIFIKKCPYMCKSVWGLSFLLSESLSILTPVSQYLCYCSFIINLEIRWCESPNLCHLFQDCFGSSRFFSFPNKFFWKDANFYQKCLNFYLNCIESIDWFSELTF